jgi:hypothetical protein
MSHPLTAAPSLRAVDGSGGERRWLVDLHVADLRRYERAVAPLVAPIEAALGAGVFANRARADGRLQPVGPARRSWRRALTTLAAGGPGRAAFIGDVRRCYASIDVASVDRALAGIGIDASTREPVTAFLRACAREGIRGLPVGPSPSAIVANAVLAVADSAVSATGATWLRWVDDVIMVADDPIAAARAFDAWTASLATLGLAPHEGKCRRIGALEELEDRPNPSPAGSGMRAMMRPR